MRNQLIRLFLGFCIGLGGMVLVHTQAQGQDDPYYEDSESVLNSEQIDVDGLYQDKPKKTAADRVEEMRKKLEKKK